MSNRVRWGILGCAGIAARSLIPAFRASETGELAAIASRDPKKARDWAGRFGIPAAHRSYASLLADPAIDAVYIPLANHLHAPWTRRALRAGKHVLCEKPIALDAREARTMAAAAARSGRLLMEAFMYRFHPQIERALEIVRSGAIGEVRLVRSSFTFPFGGDPSDYRWSVRWGGGSLLDVGCYPVSAARLVFGAEPRAAYARGRFHPRRRVDLSVSALLEFPGGRLAQLDSSFETQFQSRLEIAGSAGRVELPRAFSQKSFEVGVRLVRGDEETDVPVPAANAYVRMIDHFGAAVLERRPLRYDGRDAVLNMKVIDAVFRSLAGGRAVAVGDR
jgi:xylose dehydrogenase (NAD/NADP)